MRRRRRTRGTWFPNIGTAVDGEENIGGRQFILTIPAGSINTVAAVTPITFDVEHGDDSDAPENFSLADVIGSEYLLQRIVGKCFAHRETAAAGGVDFGQAVLFGAGFFVARANDAGSGGGFNTPIGSATAAELRDNYSPLDLDTVREPWIWRRTWILGLVGQKSATTAGSFANGNYPASTALYGSVADGPHIDSKVKRRITQDNRLWFVVAAINYPAPATGNSAVSVVGYLDYRLFGSLRKARQTSAF